jgi:hypothetical protein
MEFPTAKKRQSLSSSSVGHEEVLDSKDHGPASGGLIDLAQPPRFTASATGVSGFPGRQARRPGALSIFVGGPVLAGIAERSEGARPYAFASLVDAG